MIKKGISIIIIYCFLLSGSVIYAEDSAPAAPSLVKPAAVSRLLARTKPADKVVNAKVWAAETKSGLAEMNSNRNQINQLQLDSDVAYKSAKSRVKQLQKNKDSLTYEQVDALKKAASALSKDKQQMEGSIGNIHKESLKLKAARNSRNLKAYKKALENIIEIQETRIQLLKTVIADMERISAM